MSEAVTKTIVGQCEEISEKNGWTTFAVNVGSQYPVKVSTKVAAVVEAARAVGTAEATWTFKESDGAENPNRPGTHYKNRWLDKVELGEHAPADTPNTSSTAAPERPQAGEHAPLAVGDRERSIVRQACLKAAATLFAGQGNVEKVGEGVRDNVGELIAAASRMEIWVYRDLEDPPF